MNIFQKSVRPVINQSLVIGGAKFIALSMPFVDIIMLSKMAFDKNALSDYIFSTQIIQIFVVLSLSLSIGIPIFYNKINDKKHALQISISYAYLLGIVLFLLSILLFLCLDNYQKFTDSQYLTYLCLAIGILPLPAYIIFSHILDTMGKSNYTFGVTLIFAVLNIILNAIFVLFINNYDQVAVSLSTTIIRFLGFLIFFILICREFKIKYFLPKMDKKYFMEICSFGASEAISSLIFVISFAALTYYITFNFSSEIIEQYGILLNFINTIFVIYIGLSISISIHLSKISGINNIKWNNFIILYCIAVGVIVFLTIPFFSWLYFGNFDFTSIYLMIPALLVAVFDGISVAIISKLRVLGFKKYPPLFRLLFAFIGVPFGVICLHYFQIFGLFAAFALINLMILFLIFYFDKKMIHDCGA